MKRRTGDLWWVSPPGAVGPLVIALLLVVVAIVASLTMSGRYLEAVLAIAAGVFFLCLAILDVLGEILGSVRDLNAVLGGQKKEDTGRPA